MGENSNGNLLDRAISYIAPKWGAERQAFRAAAGVAASYRGAVATRLSNSWPTGDHTIGSAVKSHDLQRMRERARHLERNNAVADGILNRCVENVVGQGFQHQATTDDNDWNTRAEELFADWAESADITGLTWLEHQRLVFRSHLRDGDVGSILLKDGKLQPVEGDLICSPLGKPKEAIIDGVGVNRQGRPVNFYVNSYDLNGKSTSTIVTAADFVFFPRLKRLSQVRGEPCFAQTFGLFDQIDGWIEATIVAARMAACFGVAITKNNSQQFLKNLGTEANGAGVQQRQITFEPGMAPILEPGESITTINPSNPQQSFPDNLVSMLRLLGLQTGMPLELVLMDFSRTNFASARASMLQAYRSFKTVQHLYIDRYLRRIYRWRISKFINEGKLAARADAFSHRWIAQPWPFLDPIKEAQAVQLNIDMGLETLHGALMAQGSDFTTWLATRKRELAEMKAADIPVYHHSAMIASKEADAGPAAVPAAESDTDKEGE